MRQAALRSSVVVTLLKGAYCKDIFFVEQLLTGLVHTILQTAITVHMNLTSV